MRPAVLPLVVLYGASVANFYHKSNGFEKFHGDMYAVWKIIPMLVLSTFVGLHGLGLKGSDRWLTFFGVVFGGLGDWLIGMHTDGIVTGAIAFGIGHVCYMLTFAGKTRKIAWGIAGVAAVWGVIANQLCLVPMMSKHPIHVAIMMAYSLVLASAAILAASQYYHGSTTHVKGDQGLLLRCAGFSSFFFSDSVLIFNHVGFAVPAAECLILFSYFAAQILIVVAAGRLSQTEGKKIKSK